MDEESPFFLSFADALTCVFGAAIALFLIFVTLVKVAPPQDAAQAQSRDQRINRSLGSQSGAGGVDVTIRLQAEDCNLLKGLSLSNGQTGWITGDWPRSVAGGNEGCQRVLKARGSDLESGLSLTLARHTQSGEVKLWLQIGAVDVTGPGGLDLKLKYCPQGRPLRRFSALPPYISGSCP